MDKKRVLVLDDDDYSRDLIVDLVAGEGVGEVSGADSVLAALEAIGRNPPDLLIADVDMAPVNGLELVKLIRCGETPAPASLPIIVVTGHSDDVVLGTALLLDVNSILVKPLRGDDLAVRLHRVWARPQGVKPPLAYSLVDASDAGRLGQALEWDRLHGAAMSAGSPHYRVDAIEPVSRQVADLKPGDVLFDDLLLNGNKLYNRGRVLDATDLDRLLDLEPLLRGEHVRVLPGV